MTMNKYILSLLLLTACSLQGCNDNKPAVIVEYIATTYYNVDNRSDKTLKFVIVYSRLDNGTDLSRTVSILPGELKEIGYTSEMCGENYMIREYPGDVLPFMQMVAYVEMLADDIQVNGQILDKENWVFTAEEYYTAEYLLVVTNESIESAGYIQ